MQLIIHAFSDSKIHGANMGPIWGRQDLGGPHVAPWTLLSGCKFNHVSKGDAAAVISKGRHVDNLLVSDCTGGCHSDSLRYSQWGQSYQDDYILVSVYKTYIKLRNLQQNRWSLCLSQSIVITYAIDHSRPFENFITNVIWWSVKSKYQSANL